MSNEQHKDGYIQANCLLPSKWYKCIWAKCTKKLCVTSLDCIEI